jgi:hypothetical protein
MHMMYTLLYDKLNYLYIWKRYKSSKFNDLVSINAYDVHVII